MLAKFTKDEIKKAIKSAGYTKQQDLAEKMGISKSDLSNRISYGSNDFIRELEVNYGVKFDSSNKDEHLTEKIDELAGKVQKLESQCQAWQVYAATLLEEMEKQGIVNKELRVQFYSLLKINYPAT